MHGILPIDYLSHHILLVQAIFILLSTSIGSESLHHAEKLIQHYCYKFEHYYDQRYISAYTYQQLCETLDLSLLLPALD